MSHGKSGSIEIGSETVKIIQKISKNSGAFNSKSERNLVQGPRTYRKTHITGSMTNTRLWISIWMIPETGWKWYTMHERHRPPYNTTSSRLPDDNGPLCNSGYPRAPING